MCSCDKPTINGEMGYKWQLNDRLSIYPVNPPTVDECETIVFDEPGRCGGQDSHSFHYRVTRGSLYVRHGGGDECIRLSNSKGVITSLESLDSNGRYWMLNAIYHAHSDAHIKGRSEEMWKWRIAAAEKRIKTRKNRNQDSVKVWIEEAVSHS